ncbi:MULTISPECIES: glutathione peroxidase [Acetobacteraceae]|uniref:Glutathione peroxidase n=2 Tax=Acetobacteraceae TaxID=433 RepID=A0ABX4ZM86_9PROT|nr:MULTISPECIES: glutathione peroxidase [Acetobacteraceae]MCL1562000.1 glutathione peroxidase [Parasaccharibacter sp. TMW 2.1886]QGT74910.1 glutathione peroxidase [Bombella sp. ESL0368]MBE1723036.1 glutathione peroxidase [Bombella apis]MBR9730843.1 glutathione peroxidase [Bombella apis]MCL1511117.1 glutathione peroxidase [Parasaccharibacter sp. TMW 2.1884]
MTSFYDFRLPALEGGEIDLSQWRGRPVLVVNTASECGFTKQYEGLQTLWRDMGHSTPDGLIVLGVPSNDFGRQEPGTSEQISQFCQRRYGVSFPLAARSVVRGTEAIPLFHWLAKEGGFLSLPRWNFYKYLIDRQGKLHRWFTPLTDPQAPRLLEEIRRVSRKHA